MNLDGDLMTYNNFINIYTAIYNYGEKLWTYEKMLDHNKDLVKQYEV